MLGLFVPSLYGSENLIYRLQNKSACIFYINPTRPLVNNNLPIFHAHEINGFQHPIVVTNIDTLYYAKKATYKGPIIFYMRELEWLKKDEYYENQYMHYQDPNIIYVSNSDWVAKEVKICWGTDSQVIREVEFDHIYDLRDSLSSLHSR